MSKKEIAIKEETALALPQMDDAILAQLPQAEASDFKIPNLTLVQPTSKIEGNAGDIIDSSTKLKVCSINEKLVFVPLFFFKDFAIYEDTPERKYLRSEPKTVANSHYATKDGRKGSEKNQDGKDVKVDRIERLNLYVILEKDLSEAIPQIYQYRFKGSSAAEAKKLLNFWTMAAHQRQYPYSFLWSVRPKLVTDQKGKYVVSEVAPEIEGDKRRQVNLEQFKVVDQWVKIILSNKDAITKKSAQVSDETETVVADSGMSY